MASRTIQIDDALDAYLFEQALDEPTVLAELRERTQAMPMGGMQIGPLQARVMSFLVRLIDARRVVEIGTFTGYSSITFAQAMPEDGRVFCCDVSKEFTDVAREFWDKAGVAHKVELHLAPAGETLSAWLDAGQAGTFDLAFIDADKTGYDAYYEACLKLLRPGGLVLIDNTLWHGKVADPQADDADTQAIRALNRKVFDDPRVDPVLLPVGDGVLVARKR